MNPVLGAKDDLRYFAGRLGGIGRELEAEQGQGQRHLHLIHGKLLPDAVPGVKQSSSATQSQCWAQINPRGWIPALSHQHTTLPLCSSGGPRRHFGWQKQGHGLSRGNLGQQLGRGAPGCVFNKHREGGEMGKPKGRPAEPRWQVSKHEGLQHVCLVGVSTGRREGLGAVDKGESKDEGVGWGLCIKERRRAGEPRLLQAPCMMPAGYSAALGHHSLSPRGAQ